MFRMVWMVCVLVIALLPVSVAFSLPATTPGNIVFEDDFATYSNRWREYETPKANVIYQDGALAMRVKAPGASVWSVPDFNVALQTYSIAVTVAVNSGERDAGFGFVLDYHNDGNFYALIIAVDGTWSLWRRVETNWIDLTPEDAATFDFETGMSTARLRVDVLGDTLVLWADDQPIGEMRLAEAMAGGSFGLVAQAGRGCIDVAFDDVVVRTISDE